MYRVRVTLCSWCNRPTTSPTGWHPGHAYLWAERARLAELWRREALSTRRHPTYGRTVTPLIGGEWRRVGLVQHYVRAAPRAGVSDRVPSDGTALPERQDTPA